MKNTKKITLAGLSAACALTLTLGVGFLANNQTTAIADEGNGAPSAAYFYDNLIDSNNNEYTLAKKFYDVLDKMNKDGDLLDGVVDYSLEGIVTSAQIEDWMSGRNLEVPKAFSAARDAYYVDHPEIFYIDFRKITISVAKSGGAYVGFINSGREANLYYDDGINTQAAVTEAIAKFNARVDEIVAEMNKREEDDTYTARDAYLAKEVNKYLAQNIEYDYVAYDNKDNANYIAAANIQTAYGGLVEGKAVCGGFSFSYKVIMDKLGIPCLNVKGYSNNKDENGNNSNNGVGHMWNYVWLETPDAQSEAQAKTPTKARVASADNKSRAAENGGKWYSVDVTYNNAAGNKYRYALLNGRKDEEIHVADGMISSSGYRLTYPELSEFSYGNTGNNGFDVYTDYTPYSNGDLDDFGKPLQYLTRHVSYNGKSAAKLLEEDGLYLVYRDSYYSNGELLWTDWASLEVMRQFYIKDHGSVEGLFDDTGDESAYYDNTSGYCTQYAIFDVKPDREAFWGHDPETESWYFYYYKEETLNDNKAIEISDTYVNEAYGTYVPPPYINSTALPKQTISDSMRGKDGIIPENKAFVFTFSYDQPLEILDPDQPIGVTFVTEHPNTKDYAKFYPVGKDDNGNDVYVELLESKEGSGVFDTLKFKFAPSLMYEHDQEKYFFNFINVGSARLVEIMSGGKPTGEYRVSHKAPNTASATFGREVIACPAFFNYDGRLYIDCCAVPTLVSQTDLSGMDFTYEDEDGETKSFFENQRSQMMLVAEKATTETVDTMLDEITDSSAINVDKNDIKTSETYDISLRMCGKYPTISDGSYVKIALGFPEGYGPKDEGVTFKLFHRKHDPKTDTYSIEEVPCVVTQFGIVATVTNFSPYMVAVVDADKATDKTVYASIEGKGGTLTKEDGKIISFKEGDSHTYTIQPDAGYKIYTVTLNGVSVADKIVNGKLTLGYADLATNNELVIQYISNEAADRIQQKLDNNIIDENVVVDATKYVTNVPDGNGSGSVIEPEKNNTAIIVITVVAVVAVVAIGVALTIVIVRKKKNS